jgi:hypothetical protein
MRKLIRKSGSILRIQEKTAEIAEGKKKRENIAELALILCVLCVLCDLCG